MAVVPQFRQKYSLALPTNVISLENGNGETFITNPLPYRIKIPANTLVVSANPMTPYDVLGQLPETPDQFKSCPVNTLNPRSPEIDPDIATFKFSDNLSSQQQLTLYSLLSKYRKAFAFDPKELGRTDQAQHYIDTGENPPVRQPPYRVSYLSL